MTEIGFRTAKATVTNVTVGAALFTITASFRGRPHVVKTYSIDVQPNPAAESGGNICYFAPCVTEFSYTVRDSVDVYAVSETNPDLPTAFSAGSQPNSEIKIIKRGIASLKYFRIFNRWGQMLFEARDINQGEDEQFKGLAQPLGVYIYMVEAVTNTGIKFTKQRT